MPMVPTLYDVWHQLASGLIDRWHRWCRKQR